MPKRVEFILGLEFPSACLVPVPSGARPDWARESLDGESSIRYEFQENIGHEKENESAAIVPVATQTSQGG